MIRKLSVALFVVMALTIPVSSAMAAVPTDGDYTLTISKASTMTAPGCDVAKWGTDTPLSGTIIGGVVNIPGSELNKTPVVTMPGCLGGLVKASFQGRPTGTHEAKHAPDDIVGSLKADGTGKFSASILSDGVFDFSGIGLATCYRGEVTQWGATKQTGKIALPFTGKYTGSGSKYRITLNSGAFKLPYPSKSSSNDVVSKSICAAVDQQLIDNTRGGKPVIYKLIINAVKINPA